MIGNNERKLIESDIKCSMKYNGMTREEAVAKVVQEWERRVTFESNPPVWNGPDGPAKTAWEGCNAKRLSFCQARLEELKSYK